MTVMNKAVFAKKESGFNGQCMCIFNCTTEKCESTSASADVKTEVKKAYSGK